MTDRVPLDNIDHADLTVAIRYGADLGDAVNQMLVFPTEFEQVQREYPIVFRQQDSAFYAVALLGLDLNENLFLRGDRWQARYVPAIRQRGPFGRTDDTIQIDRDDPRVGTGDGEPLFLRHGGQAPYLQHIARVLDVVAEGQRSMAPTFAALAEAGLLHPTQIAIDLGDGQSYVVPDIHVVAQDRLAALDGATLQRLSQSGVLRIAYMAAASLENINHLIALRQERDAS